MSLDDYTESGASNASLKAENHGVAGERWVYPLPVSQQGTLYAN
jgi:hypothetical protein